MQKLSREQQQLIADKSPKNVPSKALKYIFQLPAYNEIPDDEIISAPGNVVECVYSMMVSVDRLAQQDKTAPSQVEILVNVNNKANVSHAGRAGTLGNQRTLDLFKFIGSDKPLARLPSDFNWVNKGSEVYKTYKVFGDLYRKLSASGLQVHVIDCTDGASLNTGCYTQGARRELLGQIALARFSGSEIPPKEQIMIFCDADEIFVPEYLTNIAKEGDWFAEGTVLFSPPYFVKDVHSADEFQDEIDHTMLYYHSRNLMKSIKLINRLDMSGKENKNKTTFSALLCTFVVNVPAYREAGGFDMQKDSREDSTFRKALEGSKDIKFMLNPNINVIRKDRIRQESYIGGLDRRKELLGEEIGMSSMFQSFLQGAHSKGLLDIGSVSLFNFASKLYERLNAELQSAPVELGKLQQISASYASDEQGKYITLFVFAKTIELSKNPRLEFPVSFKYLSTLGLVANGIDGSENMLNIFSKDRPDIFNW